MRAGTSPPESVIPPLVALKPCGSSRILFGSSSEMGAPSFMRKVSGLWRYKQRNGQPLRETVMRVPGPSAAVTNSQVD